MKRKSGRGLKLANSGRWYVAMTIGFGVVAISSGNNVLYLLESLLLGGLILSGVLSERTVVVIDIRWKRKPVIAGSPGSDQVTVRNRGVLPVFCVEVGEWRADGMHTRLFIPMLPAKSEVAFTVDRPYERRGIYEWKGVSCATQYPFGFAKKIRWVLEPGQRLIWPARASERKGPPPRFIEALSGRSADQEFGRSRRPSSASGSSEFCDGEIRPLQFGDDYRDVVWTLSAHRGEPVVRQRQRNDEVSEWILDLRRDPGASFEQEVSRVAEEFYRKGDGTLILVDWSGHRQIDGYKRALDALATVEPCGSVARSA